MKYYLELLDNLKKEKIVPVNLFYGPESYLRHQAVQEYKNKLIHPDMEQFNFSLFEGGEVTVEKVLETACSLPVFGKMRLVVVKRAPYFSSGNVPEALLEYIKYPVKSTCLIFETGEDIDRRKKINKLIMKTEGVIEFSRLNKNDLLKWITQLARRKGKQITPEGKQLILDRCGSEMYDILNEINKLINYIGERETVTEEDVNLVAVSHGEENVFVVVDALGNRQFNRALEGIKSLLLQKESPQAILGMLARQVRLMIQAKELYKKGSSFSDGCKHMGVPNFVCKKVFSQCRNFSHEQLLALLEGIMHVDYEVKTGKQDFYTALEIILLDLCIE
ncbi:MAG: DNA polymerase III subunit delta [Clostridiales bacterium]|nr:DNA polymerase III subunit delta [Clostridiales bacterium]MCF8021464.1 DNA polymerase III subunit delta [Clostridiales bacterium]